MVNRLTFLSDLALAWRLLTVIPLPLLPENFERPAGRATAYFPLVGAGLGLLLAVSSWLLLRLLPAQLAAALALALWAALTGLLHLDGLMDSCDGLLPPRDPARRLEIMKDSRVGAFGVIGAILLLLIKFNGLLVLLDSENGAVLKTAPFSYPLTALIIIPTLARWSMTWQMARYPLARQEGLSGFFRQGLGHSQLIGASLVAAGLALGIMGWPGALLLALTWLIATLLARLALARLGGLTGDIYGATCEVVEMALLVVAAAGSLGGP